MNDFGHTAQTHRSTLAYTAEVAPPMDPQLAILAQRLTVSAERISIQGNTVMNFVDRACGSRPQSSEANPKPINPAGVLNECLFAAGTISDRLDFLESEVARLNGIA